MAGFGGGDGFGAVGAVGVGTAGAAGRELAGGTGVGAVAGGGGLLATGWKSKSSSRRGGFVGARPHWMDAAGRDCAGCGSDGATVPEPRRTVTVTFPTSLA